MLCTRLKRQAAVVAAAIVSAAFFIPVARAQDIPWDRITDAQGLDATQRKVAEAVLRTAPCYGGCDGTILECLIKGDAIGIRLANFVARRAAAGEATGALLASVGHRKLSAFPPELCKVDLSGLVPSGHRDAPVRVVAYADFECPHCRVAVKALREISLEHPDLVSVWFKNYPLSQDPRSIRAALAYLAADRQGSGWEMIDQLYAQERELTPDALNACAVAVGLDMDQFHRDMASDTLLARVQAEKSEGVKCGIHSTPGIIVNGKRYLGFKEKVELLDRIEEERDLMKRALPVK